MGYSRRLASGFAVPAIALLATTAGLGWLCRFRGFYADKLLVVLIAASLLWTLRARAQRGNLMLARFVGSLDHGDFTQTFGSSRRGSGLDELGTAFDGALNRLRHERHASAAENQFSSALVDEAPTPLLAVDVHGLVHLANKAARRLFREGDGRHANAFERYGTEFSAALMSSPPGKKQICRIRWDGLLQRAVVAVALADRQGTPWRIVSIQIIQSELEAAEMATQTDLVRVLTHEIMNSLTPVTSLAVSAERALARTDASDAGSLEDARMAVGALTRRATALTGFVAAYRRFSESPSVAIERFNAAPWLQDLVTAFKATPQGIGVDIGIQLRNEALQINGDADLLGQVVLNLLKNAGQSSREAAEPEIVIALTSNEADRVVLTVSDNGIGVAPSMADEIFLPFFTTKKDGTGVGLSFAKQVILLHGGAIGLVEPTLGGATFQVVL